uniref:Uncharacterized protein n=1 Tax=Wuchereria bancrofti TaxID=6293 RepID=A0A1I8ELU7_WUCBA
MSAANDTPADDKLKSRAVSSVNGSISEEEFYRFQEQLLELRSSNYGLLGENRRQKNYIGSLMSKDTEAFLFVKDKDNSNEKPVNEICHLQRKLLSQEEEFRLQQCFQS